VCHDACVAEVLRVALTVEAAWHKVPGGTGRVAVDLARALDQRDDTSVRGISAWHFADPPADWAVPVEVTRHRLPRVLLYESWSRWNHPQLRSGSECDISHSTTVVVPPVREPLVVSVHDLAFRRYPDRFPARARRLYDRSWRRVLERADAVISPSSATSADLLAGGLDRDRLHLVPLGHDPLPIAEPDVTRVRATYNIHGPYVLAAGTLEPRKNIPALVEAMTSGPRPLSDDALLVIVGPMGWGDGHADQLGELTEAQRERVVLTGGIPTADLASLYAGASVFCYPSLLEGFGLPVLEAMSYGAPVVTSANTATEEVAGEAALTIDPSSSEAIAAGLRQVLTDPARAEEMSRLGIERASQFSWAKVAEATRAVYDEVAR
jgi:glycosyltransferase involved in cell wall biosynthesis